MRITETSSNFKTSQTKKAKNSKGSGFSGLLSGGVEGAENANEAQSAASMSSLNSLNIIGFSSGVSERQAREFNMEYGKDMLKSLELLKKAIILGVLEYNTLHNISERLNIIPVEPADFELKSLIEEIRTRAAVELEKLKKIGGYAYKKEE